MPPSNEEPKIDDLKRLLRRLEQVSSEKEIVVGRDGVRAVAKPAGAADEKHAVEKDTKAPAADPSKAASAAPATGSGRNSAANSGAGQSDVGKTSGKQDAAVSLGTGKSIPGDLASLDPAKRASARLGQLDAGQHGIGQLAAGQIGVASRGVGASAGSLGSATGRGLDGPVGSGAAAHAPASTALQPTQSLDLATVTAREGSRGRIAIWLALVLCAGIAAVGVGLVPRQRIAEILSPVNDGRGGGAPTRSVPAATTSAPVKAPSKALAGTPAVERAATASEAAPDFAAGTRKIQLQLAQADGKAASIAAVDATTPATVATPPTVSGTAPQAEGAPGKGAPASPSVAQPSAAEGAPVANLPLGESEILRAQPQTRGRDKFDSEARLDAYLERGQRMIEEGDITGARAFFRRVAESGDPRGALALGMTYDANYFAELGIRGVAADNAEAGQWYRKAMDLGSKEALDRLEKLGPN